MSRAAPLPKESHTALQNRDHTHAESSASVGHGEGGGEVVDKGSKICRGVPETIVKACSLLYGGKWT